MQKKIKSFKNKYKTHNRLCADDTNLWGVQLVPHGALQG